MTPKGSNDYRFFDGIKNNPEGVTLFALPKFLDINVNGRKILRNVNG